jgi:antagonist of KipI
MTLRVLDPGLYTLVVDFGRPTARSLGVPVGGAADRFALALGNALVGNAANTAALEMTLAGPTIQAAHDLACVVYGAPFELTIAGRHLTTGYTFTLHGGEQLHVGGTREKMRGYLCVRGGVETGIVLGSRSGLQPLAAGAELQCPSATIPARCIQPAAAWNQRPNTLRALPGPQAKWFPASNFYGQEFTVASESNRMGLRLQGMPLVVPARELVSEPVCPGAVQVTRNGQCIVLGVDGQTIGGYPKLAQVISADLDKIGQLRPGDRIRFQLITLAEAELLFRQKQAELDEWIARLHVAEFLSS